MLLRHQGGNGGKDNISAGFIGRLPPLGVEQLLLTLGFIYDL